MEVQKAISRVAQNALNMNNKGQALTEFVMIFAVLLFLILMHFQLSMNYVASSYMNYASFMAARTNLVGEDAEYVAKQMVGSPGDSYFGPFARINEIRVSPEGVTIDYTAPLYIPIIQVPTSKAAGQEGGKGFQFKATTQMGQEPQDCGNIIEDNGC